MHPLRCVPLLLFHPLFFEEVANMSQLLALLTLLLFGLVDWLLGKRESAHKRSPAGG